MRVGIIGTGAISRKHAQAYKNIGYEITVCTNHNAVNGKKFAAETGAEFVPTVEELCRHPRVDYVDVCTFPDFRLQPLEICAETKKHILVQKPIATNLETARAMVELARTARASSSASSASTASTIPSSSSSRRSPPAVWARLIQADAYVKWYRSRRIL